MELDIGKISGGVQLTLDSRERNPQASGYKIPPIPITLITEHFKKILGQEKESLAPLQIPGQESREGSEENQSLGINLQNILNQDNKLPFRIFIRLAKELYQKLISKSTEGLGTNFFERKEPDDQGDYVFGLGDQVDITKFSNLKLQSSTVIEVLEVPPDQDDGERYYLIGSTVFTSSGKEEKESEGEFYLHIISQSKINLLFCVKKFLQIRENPELLLRLLDIYIKSEKSNYGETGLFFQKELINPIEKLLKEGKPTSEILDSIATGIAAKISGYNPEKVKSKPVIDSKYDPTDLPPCLGVSLLTKNSELPTKQSSQETGLPELSKRQNSKKYYTPVRKTESRKPEHNSTEAHTQPQETELQRPEAVMKTNMVCQKLKKLISNSAYDTKNIEALLAELDVKIEEDFKLTALIFQINQLNNLDLKFYEFDNANQFLVKIWRGLQFLTEENEGTKEKDLSEKPTETEPDFKKMGYYKNSAVIGYGGIEPPPASHSNEENNNSQSLIAFIDDLVTDTNKNETLLSLLSIIVGLNIGNQTNLPAIKEAILLGSTTDKVRVLYKGQDGDTKFDSFLKEIKDGNLLENFWYLKKIHDNYNFYGVISNIQSEMIKSLNSKKDKARETKSCINAYIEIISFHVELLRQSERISSKSTEIYNTYLSLLIEAKRKTQYAHIYVNGRLLVENHPLNTFPPQLRKEFPDTDWQSQYNLRKRKVQENRGTTIYLTTD